LPANLVTVAIALAAIAIASSLPATLVAISIALFIAAAVTCLPPLLLSPSPSIRSAKQDDNYGASNIILPCPGS
jgi:hypothetical protein